jgi:hypothetical protein
MSMRTVLHDNGGKINITVFNSANVIDSVPAKIYRVSANPDDGLFLIPTHDRFNVPERKFGRHKENLRLLVGDYDRVGPSLGAIMVGLKGSGKSMLAEDTCNWAIAKGLPVIHVEESVPVSWLEMVSAAVGPAVFYFDEFGKHYRQLEERDQREALLGFFSSSTRMGSLYLVTGNDPEEFSTFMINRPGRFRYRFNFTSPEGAELNEVLDHYHIAEALRPMITAYCRMSSVGYDVLNNILPIIRGCTTEEEVHRRSEVYNIPMFPIYVIVELTALTDMVKMRRNRLADDHDHPSGPFRERRIRKYALSADRSELIYHIRVEADGEPMRLEMHRLSLNELEQYRVPLENADESRFGAADDYFEVPDASGETLLIYMGWQITHLSLESRRESRQRNFEAMLKEEKHLTEVTEAEPGEERPAPRVVSMSMGSQWPPKKHTENQHW